MPHHKEASQALVDSTELPELETPEEGIPRAIVPWHRDDDRSRYLGLRASGFGIRDCLNIIGKAKSTLSLWRNDPKFKDLEENHLPGLRRTLGLEYVGLEFLRNFRLVLEKDCRVFRKSLTKNMKLDKDGNSYEAPMDSQDFQYLLKARSLYTPQQLQAIEQLFGASDGDGSKEINWIDVAQRVWERGAEATIKQTEVKIGTRHTQPSELTSIVEGAVIGKDSNSESQSSFSA